MKTFFVIHGCQDAGKTHTAWLVLNILRNEAQTIELVSQSNYTYEETLEKINEKLDDFEAVLEIRGKSIVMASQADKLEYFLKFCEKNSFLNSDYVICCARQYNKTNSIKREIKERFDKKGDSIVKWYSKTYYSEDEIIERRNDAKSTAEKVTKDLLNRL